MIRLENITKIYNEKVDVGLVMLRRDRAGVEKMTELNCAIFLDRTTFYIKERLMEEGIPFVIDGKQVFLPFIGYLLSKGNERELAPVHLISFLTQKMLLIAIYERWNEVKVSDAAKRMRVSTKSASRCFDELEYLNINVLGMKGKSRVINIPDDRKQLWQQIESGFIENVYMKNVQAGTAQRVLEIDTEVLYQWKDLVPTYEERITRIDGIYMDKVTCESADAIYELKGDAKLPFVHLHQIFQV